MKQEVIAFVQEAVGANIPVALALLTESSPASPGVPGAMLAVRSDGACCGTIGGGASEAAVIQQCREALSTPGVNGFPFSFSLNTGGTDGMLCGGMLAGYVTLIRPKQRLLIFGGGHVGKRVYDTGLVGGFAVTLVEDRPELVQALDPATVHLTEDYAKAIEVLAPDADAYLVIVTRGHAHDLAVLRAALRYHCAYIGMIGSRGKVRALLNALQEEGFSKELLGSVFAPIGLDIDDGSPGEIAIAILAEILQHKNQGLLRHCKEKQQDQPAANH